MRRSGCDVEYQESFENASEDVIEKLSNKIYHPNDGPCDLVVHVAGNEVGATSNPKAVAGFFKSLHDEDLFLQDENHAEIKTLLTASAQEVAGSKITYTQWEAYLSFHHDVPIIVYAPEDAYAEPTASTSKRTVRDNFPQKEHLQRLYSVRKHHATYEGPSDLMAKIQADIMAHCRKHWSKEQLPAAFQLKPNNLPLSIGDLFMGRTAFIESIAEKLHPDTTGFSAANLIEIQKTKPTAVYGSGGIGKTRTAVEYAWQNDDKYSGLLFVNAESRDALITNLANLYGVLEINEVAEVSDEIRFRAVLDWLKRNPGWLAILDNVDSPEAAAAVRETLESLKNGHVLITSRISNWSGVVEPLDLGVLSIESSVEYLLEAADHRTKTDDDCDEAEKVAKQVGQLALGLEHAKAYINQFGYTFAEYLADWKNDEREILEEFDLSKIDYPRELLITWKLSLDQLDNDPRRLLEVLSWFAPDPIPESVLEKLPHDFLGGKTKKALAKLVDFSLVNRELETEIGSGEQIRTLKLHRLVQATTRYHLQKKKGGADNSDSVHLPSLESALNTMDSVFIGDPTDVRNWPVLEPLSQHAQSIADFAFINNLVTREHHTPRLLNQVGLLLREKNHFEEAERCFRNAMKIEEEIFGSDHTYFALVAGNLGQLLHDTDRLSEAEPLMRRILEIDEKALGSVNQRVATDLNNLSALLQDMNRVSEAEPLIRRALKIDEKLLGEDHPDVARDLTNLATLLLAKTSCAEAEPLMRRALQIDEHSFGCNHPKVALDLNNLVVLLLTTNRTSEAEPLIRRALTIDETSFGLNHPRVARDLLNLSALLKEWKRYSEAEPLMRRALSISEAVFGDDHPCVADHLSHIAQLLLLTNRLSDAEPLMRRSLKIYETSYGSEHPFVARSLNDLGRLLKIGKRIPEAEPLMRRALVIDEKSLGAHHPDVARDLNNLAQLLRATERCSEAEPLMRRHLEIFVLFQETTGHSHLHFETAIQNYFDLLLELGLERKDAIERIQQTGVSIELLMRLVGDSPVE